MKERKQILKKIGIVFGVIMAIFAIINLVWFFGVKIRYMHLTENMDKVVQTEEEKEQDINSRSYQKAGDGYIYKVKETGYLGNAGFASVSDEEGLVINVDKNGNVISDNGTHLTFYVWPKMFAGYKYGIDIENIDEFYQVYVDKDGNYIPDDDTDPELQEKIEALLEEYRDEVNKLFDLADEQWDIR